MYTHLSLLSYGVNFNFPPCPKIEKIAGIDFFLVNFGHRVASSIGNKQFTHALIFQISNCISEKVDNRLAVLRPISPFWR